MIKDEHSLWEQSDDEEQGDASADDKGDIEVFVERGYSSNDEEEPLDCAEEIDEDDNQILSPDGIFYTMRTIP